MIKGTDSTGIRLKTLTRVFVLLSVSAAIMTAAGCENKPASNTNATSNTSTTPPPSPKTKSGVTGTITASPSPIKVCDGTGLGITNIAWTYTGAKLVEVRVGSPDGGLLVQAGADGNKATGKWVGQGTVFYLQDVSNGLPLTADNTIATVTVNITNQGCP